MHIVVRYIQVQPYLIKILNFENVDRLLWNIIVWTHRMWVIIMQMNLKSIVDYSWMNVIEEVFRLANQFQKSRVRLWICWTNHLIKVKFQSINKFERKILPFGKVFNSHRKWLGYEISITFGRNKGAPCINKYGIFPSLWAEPNNRTEVIICAFVAYIKIEMKLMMFLHPQYYSRTIYENVVVFFLSFFCFACRHLLSPFRCWGLNGNSGFVNLLFSRRHTTCACKATYMLANSSS